MLAPLDWALNVFTDGSSNGTAAAVTAQKTVSMKVPYKSAQIVELAVIHLALVTFPAEPINLLTDNIYVAKVFPPLETSGNIATTSAVHEFLTNIQLLLWKSSHKVYIGFRAHSDLPSPVSEGNAQVDQVTHALLISLPLDSLASAQRAHDNFHLNVTFLRLTCKISKE